MDGTKRKTGKETHLENPFIRYTVDHTVRPNPHLDNLQKFTFENEKRSAMLGSPEQLQFLANLVQCIGGKKTLDIGVFTGSSSLAIAQVLPDDGKVIACDISDFYVNKARPFWKEAGVEKKIDVRIAPAKETLEQLIETEAGTFDFAFIDADKPNYDSYYELCLKLVRKGGIIAVDNVLWSGHVFDDAIQDEDTRCLRALNTKIRDDERVNANMLYLGDGTTIVFKK